MRISVVVAAFNEEKLIGDCLKAIKNQDFNEKFEIIVVDNDSSDKTAMIAKKSGALVISYKNHKGAIWAKQFGCQKATGDCLAITDADSKPEKDWLKNIVNEMRDESIVCLGGTVIPTGESKISKIILYVFDKMAILLMFFGIPLIWGSNIVVRKSAFHAVGGLNTNLKSGDDWDFVMRLQKKFGRSSVRYSSNLKVRVSPRKFERFDTAINYFIVGLINFISIFLLQKSWTFGKNQNVR